MHRIKRYAAAFIGPNAIATPAVPIVFELVFLVDLVVLLLPMPPRRKRAFQNP
jgi:hypothetical protein